MKYINTYSDDDPYLCNEVDIGEKSGIVQLKGAWVARGLDIGRSCDRGISLGKRSYGLEDVCTIFLISFTHLIHKKRMN